MQLNASIAIRGSQTKPAKKIMLIPRDHITISAGVLKCISKNQAKLTIVSSMNASHNPRFTKNEESSPLDFRRPTMNAEIPARKLKVGAQ
jgi:hypothetical protein